MNQNQNFPEVDTSPPPVGGMLAMAATVVLAFVVSAAMTFQHIVGMFGDTTPLGVLVAMVGAVVVGVIFAFVGAVVVVSVFGPQFFE